MTKKKKYQMISNKKKRKAEMNWSMTKIQNMRLYLSMITLKHPKKRNIKGDMEEQGINLKPCILRGVVNSMNKTLHKRNMCSFMTTKRG